MIAIIIFILTKYKTFDRYLKTHWGWTPLKPVEKDYEILLNQVMGLDIESKLRLLQAVYGSQIKSQLLITKSRAIILASGIYGDDIEDMMKTDRSIG